MMSKVYRGYVKMYATNEQEGTMSVSIGTARTINRQAIKYLQKGLKVEYGTLSDEQKECIDADLDSIK